MPTDEKNQVLGAPAPKAKKTAADIVTEWFNESMQNSEISRAPTPVYNAVAAAVEDLKARLTAASL